MSEANAGIFSYLSNVVQVVNFWWKTSMDTEELLVHEGSKWQAVERFHARLIYTFWIFYFTWNRNLLSVFFIYLFKVCKSVHPASSYNSNKSPTRYNNFPVYLPNIYLQFSGSLWFYLRNVVTVMLCLWSDRSDHEHSTTVTTIRR
jgi:hypothetical protein